MMQCNLRLATRRNGQRDGELMLVSPSGERWAPAGAPTPTLQALLDQWAHQAPALARRCSSLDASGWQGCAAFEDESGQFSQKPYAVLLAPGASWSMGYTVTTL